MDKRKNNTKWTEENINYLKIAYSQGASLKKIATQLNRSVSAINKTLARYNLRPHAKMSRSLPTSHSVKPQQKDKGRTYSAQQVKQFHIDTRQWVPFESVLFWLRKQKVFVHKSTSGTYYEVNGFPKNKQQILLMANILREQNQLPIFFVKGVTNS